MNEGTNAKALRDYYSLLDYPLDSRRIKADYEIDNDYCEECGSDWEHYLICSKSEK